MPEDATHSFVTYLRNCRQEGALWTSDIADHFRMKTALARRELARLERIGQVRRVVVGNPTSWEPTAMTPMPDLTAQIAREIYKAVAARSDDVELLCILGSYRDTLDDADILELLQNLNATGSALDYVEESIDGKITSKH